MLKIFIYLISNLKELHHKKFVKIVVNLKIQIEFLKKFKEKNDCRYNTKKLSNLKLYIKK